MIYPPKCAFCLEPLVRNDQGTYCHEGGEVIKTVRDEEGYGRESHVATPLLEGKLKLVELIDSDGVARVRFYAQLEGEEVLWKFPGGLQLDLREMRISTVEREGTP